MLLVGCAALVVFSANHSALAQATTEESVVVTGRGSAERLRRATGAFACPFLEHSKCLRVAPMVIFLRRTVRGSGVPPRTAGLSLHSRGGDGFALPFQHSGGISVRTI